MKNKELYQKTVDILVQAYFNDTLQHGICSACAVGNIVAANMGYKIEKSDELLKLGIDERKWFYAHEWNTGRRIIGAMEPEWWYIIKNLRRGVAINDPYGIEQLSKTGYSVHEIDKIESAFEAADLGESAEDWIFNGLMAVIDVLDEIHENQDTELTISTKQRFQKATGQ